MKLLKLIENAGSIPRRPTGHGADEIVNRAVEFIWNHSHVCVDVDEVVAQTGISRRAFAACGHKELAADIADKTVANAMQNGISERYESLPGKKLGVEYLGMNCTAITMMLDGICQKHQLKIKIKITP
ncbi:MAG: hypothetical protein WCN98_02300 [Verrucomicrobiaceae bacterium]